MASNAFRRRVRLVVLFLVIGLGGSLRAADPPATSFFRGLNLNGPPVTIDDRQWDGKDSTEYRCRDKAFENQSIPLDPPVDAATAQMIRSSRWGGNQVELTDIPSGPYSVYLYIWEDNNPEVFDIAVNGRDVARQYRTGPAGRWEKLGPWPVDVADGAIVITSRGGAANFSGVEVWRGRAAGGDSQPSAEDVAFFEKRIRPLLVKHCYECHSAGAMAVEGELLVDSRAGLQRGGAMGPAVVAGNLDKSLLIEAVRYKNDDLQMPPGGKLSDAEIADLEHWVRTGAADPRSETSLPPAKTIDLAAAREFWSFRPISDPPAPSVRDAAWPANDVDRFILAALEAKGLRPARPADSHTWLRRVTYDLTGLPPTPEEIAAFAADASPAARERIVNRLLASPAYGERWGRHWLDVVRYADTAGDNSDYPVPQLYKYRNWVIEAIGRDMPYDEFVRVQLAGDLLPASDEVVRRSNLIATGYLAGARRFGSYEDARYPWHLTIEDTIDNLGRTFLGLTINCARCHDHKFDPISNDDYYALYGFFQSTRYPWPGIELDKAPHDLVPLAPPEVVAAADKERQAKLAEFDARRKQLEADKKAADEKIKQVEQDENKEGRDQRIAAAVNRAEQLEQAIKKLRREREVVAKQAVPYEVAYAVTEAENKGKQRIGDACIQIKGDPERLGPQVPRRFPLVLGGQTLPSDTSGSGRAELAAWIVDPANPLTARVMVNRIWSYHFGRGIVPTPSDFGKQGRPPTHPELLDYLARRFMAGGWSLKAMHRLIVLSQTYGMSGEEITGNLAIDPTNETLWRFSRRRLDAESIRDTLLAVAGNLDRVPGGPHPFPDQTTWDFTQHKPFKAVFDSHCRSVYLMSQRIQRHPFLALFDGADTNAGTPVRITSTTPLQALYLMNDPFVHEQAAALAARLLHDADSDEARIERAYLLLFGRPATAAEKASLDGYLSRMREELKHSGSAGKSVGAVEAQCWASLLRGLFLSNELVYVN